MATGKHTSVPEDEATETLGRRPPAPSRPDLTVEALGARITWIEEEIGEPPHPLRNHSGSGLWQAMHNVGDGVKKLDDKLTEIIRARETELVAEKAAAAQRAAAAAPYSWLVRLAIGAAVTALVAGGVGSLLVWIAGLHH